MTHLLLLIIIIIIIININMLELQHFDSFRKDGRRKMLKIRLITSWKSWIWDQYLSKTWSGILVIWNQYLSKTLRDFESLKLRNFEAKKPRNKENKRPRNQKTRNQKPRNHETNKLSQVRESTAPLNIQTPTPAPWPLRPARGPGPRPLRGVILWCFSHGSFESPQIRRLYQEPKQRLSGTQIQKNRTRNVH